MTMRMLIRASNLRSSFFSRRFRASVPPNSASASCETSKCFRFFFSMDGEDPVDEGMEDGSGGVGKRCRMQRLQMECLFIRSQKIFERFTKEDAQPRTGDPTPSSRSKWDLSTWNGASDIVCLSSPEHVERLMTKG